MSDDIRREDVLNCIRRGLVKGANPYGEPHWPAITDAIRALPPSPRAAAAQRLAEWLDQHDALIQADPLATFDRGAFGDGVQARLAAWREGEGTGESRDREMEERMRVYKFIDEDTWFIAARSNAEAVKVYREQCADIDLDDPPTIKMLSIGQCTEIVVLDDETDAMRSLADLCAEQEERGVPACIGGPSWAA